MDPTHPTGTDADTAQDRPAERDVPHTPAELAGEDATTFDGAAPAEAKAGPEADAAVPTDRTALTEVVGEIEERGFDYEVLGRCALRVEIPAGDPVMGVVPLLETASSAVAVLAATRDGSSAVVMRDGEDLFVIKRSPGAWEHFRSRGGPSAIYGSWRGGERTRFRMRHGALWQKIPAAEALAERLGVADLLPPETPPPPPRPAPEKPKRTRTPRTSTRPASASTAGAKPAASTKPATKSKAKEEPAPKICPRCFVQLPASGVCDCG